MSSSAKSKTKKKVTKAPPKVPELAPKQDVPFRELIAWLEAQAMVRGHGGKGEVAERLGINPDVLSQLFRRQAGLDRKTVNLLMWMISSKAEDYLECPVLETVQIDQLVLERRQMGNEEDWTWRKASE